MVKTKRSAALKARTSVKAVHKKFPPEKETEVGGIVEQEESPDLEVYEAEEDLELEENILDGLDELDVNEVQKLVEDMINDGLDLQEPLAEKPVERRGRPKKGEIRIKAVKIPKIKAAKIKPAEPVKPEFDVVEHFEVSDSDSDEFDFSTLNVYLGPKQKRGPKKHYVKQANFKPYGIGPLPRLGIHYFTT